MRRSIGIIGLLASSLMFIQCEDIRTGNGNQVQLARVGSSYLTLDEARNAIPPFQLEQDSLKSLLNYRDSWIREQLLLNEAQHLQLEQQQTVQKRLQKAREEVIKNALKELIIAQFTESVNITGHQIEKYFEEHKTQLLLPEPYVQFRRIETRELNEARNAREQLRNDVYWPSVAQNYSLNPEQRVNEAAKFWPASAVLNDLPSIKPYVTSLDSGAISPIHRENGTYHFIQLTGKRAEGEFPDAEWFRDELQSWLLIEKQRNHYNSYLKNLYLNAKEDNELDVYNVLSTDSVNLD